MVNDEKKYTIVICTVTGTQGREIVGRFRKLLATGNSNTKNHIRGLTRDKSSARATKLLEGNEEFLSLVNVDYGSEESIREALKGMVKLSKKNVYRVSP